MIIYTSKQLLFFLLIDATAFSYSLKQLVAGEKLAYLTFLHNSYEFLSYINNEEINSKKI